MQKNFLVPTASPEVPLEPIVKNSRPGLTDPRAPSPLSLLCNGRSVHNFAQTQNARWPQTKWVSKIIYSYLEKSAWFRKPAQRALFCANLGGAEPRYPRLRTRNDREICRSSHPQDTSPFQKAALCVITGALQPPAIGFNPQKYNACATVLAAETPASFKKRRFASSLAHYNPLAIGFNPQKYHACATGLAAADTSQFQKAALCVTTGAPQLPLRSASIRKNTNACATALAAQPPARFKKRHFASPLAHHKFPCDRLRSAKTPTPAPPLSPPSHQPVSKCGTLRHHPHHNFRCDRLRSAKTPRLRHRSRRADTSQFQKSGTLRHRRAIEPALVIAKFAFFLLQPKSENRQRHPIE